MCTERLGFESLSNTAAVVDEQEMRPAVIMRSTAN